MAKIKSSLTQDELKKLVSYDPLTGAIISTVSRGRARIGKTLGFPDNGYFRICIYSRVYFAHELAFLYMAGYIPDEIDHKDRKRANNIWSNLRSVTRQENSRNAGLSKNSTSGIIGVTWDAFNQKWRAKIRVDYKTICLGRFTTKIAAANARHQANLKYGFS